VGANLGDSTPENGGQSEGYNGNEPAGKKGRFGAYWGSSGQKVTLSGEKEEKRIPRHGLAPKEGGRKSPSPKFKM